MTTAPNAQQLVQQWQEWFNAHDADSIASSYAEDAMVIDPQYQEALRGREAIRQDIADLFAGFSDLSMDPARIFTQDQTVIVELHLRGTHDGTLSLPSGSIEATNKPVEFNVCLVSDLDADGHVSNERRYYDLATMMWQIGVVD